MANSKQPTMLHRDDVVLRAMRAGVTVEQLAIILNVSTTWASQLVTKTQGK